ncbi:hypothetical protein BD309DRAFT_828876, partial [Dichomitus squalens]
VHSQRRTVNYVVLYNMVISWRVLNVLESGLHLCDYVYEADLTRFISHTASDAL